MWAKIHDFLQYYKESIKVPAHIYRVDTITIEDNTIVIHYHCTRDKSSLTFTTSIDELMVNDLDFDKVDKVKLDTCSVLQSVLNSIDLLSLEPHYKNQVIQDTKKKIAEITGAERI